MISNDLLKELKRINPFELLEFALCLYAEKVEVADGSWVEIGPEGFIVHAVDVDPAPDATRRSSERVVAHLTFGEDWQDNRYFPKWENGQHD